MHHRYPGDRPEFFMEGIRVLMLIDRGVGNTNKGSKRWINKLISTNQEDFKRNLKLLIEQQVYINNPDVRIYGCINSRNLDKAIRYFQHKQLDLSTDDMKLFFYKDIRTSFVSALMKPENRDSKLYLLDLDVKDREVAHKFSHKHNIEVIHYYESPNGWHYIVKPFDVRLVAEIPECTVVKDGLMIWNVL